jgi:hypothetical protein
MNLARYKGQVTTATCYLCVAGFFLGSFFDPEADYVFFQNVS